MSRFLILGAVLAAAAGCTEVEGATDLHVDGPPMIRQVFMNEVITSSSGTIRPVKAIAFGDHPDFDRIENELDDRVVTTGDVLTTNKIRVVVDELLVGNNLEEIACRERPDLGIPEITYSRVPEGTTPDDIARCATANDILDSTCNGPHAVCLSPTGEPIGVLDEVPTGGDGASDTHRFIANIVNVECGGIDVPLDLANTFWQPAGNQQVPAAGEFDAVGPAIIIVTSNGFPTSSDCTIDFDDDIVDKDRNSICAPPNGGWNDGELDADMPCEGGNDAGDTSLVAWTTEPLRVKSTVPTDNQTGVARTASGSTDARGSVTFNAPIQVDDNGAPAPGAIVLMEGSTERTDIHGTCTAIPPAMGTVPCIQIDQDAAKLNFIVPGGYLADTTYMLTVTADNFDAFGVALPEAQVTTITWTTAP
jgi:hypothetical protein